MQIKDKIGFVNGIIASSSYGTNPFFALPLLSWGLGVNSILFYRYSIAVLIYYFWLKFKKKVNLKLQKIQIFWAIILGTIFSLSSISLFISFKYIDSGVACTILFIYPVIVMLIMTAFFNEKINKTTIFATFLAIFGIVLLNYSNQTNSMATDSKGLALILISALAYALYLVGIRTIKVIKHAPSDIVAFYVMVAGVLFYAVNLKFCTNLEMLTTPKEWFCAFGLALLPTIISLETTNIAIKFIGASKTAVLGALEPLTAVILGILVFHEQFTVYRFFGVLFVLVGVLMIINQSRQTSIQRINSLHAENK